MKFLFAFVLASLFATDIDRIARINELKDEAREAYNSGNYDLALKNYRYLVDSMDVVDDKVMLNLANTLYQLKDTTQAMKAYQTITGSPDRLIGSVAHQQLGILSNRTKEYEAALNHFKQALKKDPSNDDARYNYELLKKAMDEKKKEEEQKKEENKEENKEKKDQEGKDEKSEQEENQQNQQKKEDKEGEQEKQKKSDQSEEGEEENEEQKDSEKTKESEEKQEKTKEEKEGTPSEEETDEQKNEARQQEIAERLKDMKISEEKAKMILEAMKNNEIQYIQQNKRKATKKKDSSKPDW
jgi:hypothetical protein